MLIYLDKHFSGTDLELHKRRGRIVWWCLPKHAAMQPTGGGEEVEVWKHPNIWKLWNCYFLYPLQEWCLNAHNLSKHSLIPYYTQLLMGTPAQSMQKLWENVSLKGLRLETSQTTEERDSNIYLYSFISDQYRTCLPEGIYKKGKL